MANPYTSVTVANYNSSPPADDGSAVSANQLAWSKHKTKLGDPLKTAIESINTNAIAAFGKRIGTTFEAKSTAYPIVPGDQGKFFSVTGTTTITLPAVADAGDGFPIVILNDGVGVVTIDGNASELINGEVSLALGSGGWAFLTTDGAEWVALSSGAHKTFTPTWVGFSSAPAGDLSYVLSNGFVTIYTQAALLGTSNSTGFSLSGLPAEILPIAATAYATVNLLVDNNNSVLATALAGSAGTLAFIKAQVSGADILYNNTVAWTPTGTKGLRPGTTITYKR